MPDWQDQVELHRIYQDARSNRDSFFEKLTILNGGTVALVITAVLGPLHGVVRHKILLGTGLTLLVFAMLALLFRNFLAAELEFHLAGETSHDLRTQQPKMRAREQRLIRSIRSSQSVGALLSAAGILSLLIEVWMILYGSTST